MNVTPTDLPGTLIIEPDVYGDERGFFMETWNRARYAEHGLDFELKQCNLSRSRKGVLRGLHYQHPNPQGKLVQVLEGRVFDVAVDIRPDSPHFGRWTGVWLDGETPRQFWIPEGFAHGFCVVSETALFAYGCTRPYDAEADRAIAWNDETIAVDWPLDGEPELSDKDRKAPRLAALSRNDLPE